MANSTQVTALATSIQRKSAYRGNAQVIPVTMTAATTGTYYVSEKLPPICNVVAAALAIGDFGTAFTVTVGDEDTATSIASLGSGNAAVLLQFPVSTSTAGVVDVGGKTLQIVIAGADNTASISGYIVIVTDE